MATAGTRSSLVPPALRPFHKEQGLGAEVEVPRMVWEELADALGQEYNHVYVSYEQQKSAGAHSQPQRHEDVPVGKGQEAEGSSSSAAGARVKNGYEGASKQASQCQEPSGAEIKLQRFSNDVAKVSLFY